MTLPAGCLGNKWPLVSTTLCEREKKRKGGMRKTRRLIQRLWAGLGLKQAAKVLGDRRDKKIYIKNKVERGSWPAEQQIVSEFPEFTGFRR